MYTYHIIFSATLRISSYLLVSTFFPSPQQAIRIHFLDVDRIAKELTSRLYLLNIGKTLYISLYAYL